MCPVRRAFSGTDRRLTVRPEAQAARKAYLWVPSLVVTQKDPEIENLHPYKR